LGADGGSNNVAGVRNLLPALGTTELIPYILGITQAAGNTATGTAIPATGSGWGTSGMLSTVAVAGQGSPMSITAGGGVGTTIDSYTISAKFSVPAPSIAPPSKTYLDTVTVVVEF
jgi:hypothetical protein